MPVPVSTTACVIITNNAAINLRKSKFDLPLENGTPNIPKLGESNGNSQLYRRI